MDKKIVIGILFFTAVIIGGGVIFSSNQSSKATLEKTPGAKVQTIESSFDFKDVKYSGGNVQHSYKIKNIGNKDLTVANLKTSCMCTKTYFQSKKEKGPEFGMEGHSSASNWTGILRPSEEGQMVVVFDPTAHGPEGIGPVSRFISFETNDPDHPYVELSFTGTVIK